MPDIQDRDPAAGAVDKQAKPVVPPAAKAAQKRGSPEARRAAIDLAGLPDPSSAFYVTQGRFPVQSFGYWNLVSGFALLISGFAMTMRWK